jgi:NADH dehydrogenase
MILLTGATGLVGGALLPRLLADGETVRCLVREPRRLGAQRVRVQIALGDLADPPSFRNAMRGVDTIVHLASSTRDQTRGSIEELAGIASWRMVDAAQRAGASRFVFLSLLGASTHHRSRLFRAKALAEQAVAEADLHTTILAPSLVYAPGDRRAQLLARLSLLPAVPVPGSGRAEVQPIWVEDVAECMRAALRRAPAEEHERFELAGPQTLTWAETLRLILRALERPRPLAHLPAPLVSRALQMLERAGSDSLLPTWDEAELAEVAMTSAEGSAGARRLGVEPGEMPAVLGLDG